MPAEFTLLPLVAGERGLARANGQVEFARYAGFILGPGAGGLLAAAGGTTCALLANAGTFLVLAAVAAAIRVEWAPHAHAARERMREGIAFLARDAELAPVVGIVVRLPAADDRDAGGRAVLRRRATSAWATPATGS